MAEKYLLKTFFFHRRYYNPQGGYKPSNLQLYSLASITGLNFLDFRISARCQNEKKKRKSLFSYFYFLSGNTKHFYPYLNWKGASVYISCAIFRYKGIKLYDFLS